MTRFPTPRSFRPVRLLLPGLLLVLCACGTTPSEDPGPQLVSRRAGTSHELRLRLIGFEEATGSVRVAVYESPEHLEAQQAFAGTVQVVSASEMLMVFNVPNGTWAITSFHDANNNGELDTNLVGMPTEPFAFSNNARGEFGPPTFEQMAFEVADAGLEMEIDFR